MAALWTFFGSAVLCYAYAAYVILCAIALTTSIAYVLCKSLCFSTYNIYHKIKSVYTRCMDSNSRPIIYEFDAFTWSNTTSLLLEFFVRHGLRLFSF